MARIGSALLVALVAASAQAETELYQTVDRTKVGTEDTFTLEIVVTDPPEGAELQFPTSKDFEVLSQSRSTQASFQIGAGGQTTIQRINKHSVVMRANHAGKLTIPGAQLKGAGKTLKAQPITLDVVAGRLAPPPAPRRQTPPGFPNFPGFPGFPDDDDGFFPPGFRPQEPDIPRNDSDIFIRLSLDRDEVYVGEQATLLVTVYSRFDLSNIDTVTMPKLDGFWSEDLATATRLEPQTKEIGGVPYRAYLLRQRALFPVKSGTIAIEPVEADITTGFLVAGQRVHRKSNALSLKVKPLPGGAGRTANVGKLRLSTEVSQTHVALGEPITLRLVLEGRGNLRNIELPKLAPPPGLKVYEPQITDAFTVLKGQFGGKRVLEYIILAQQTGTFTLPGLSLESFDPETKQYTSSATDPVELTVTPGANGGTQLAVGTAPNPLDPNEKNQLSSAGLKPLRYAASFTPMEPPLFSRAWFPPAVGAPFALAVLLALGSLTLTALRRSSPEADRARQAKEARARLKAARELALGGKVDAFYGEVERALLSFLEARCGQPMAGLTREALVAALGAHGASEATRARVVAVLDRCDTGRFAPGMGESAAKKQTLDDAAAAMEAFS